MAVRKSILKNEEGQALIEFLLFLPFMLMIYALISSVSSSLNSAINQQKITRGYFYHRVQNNSMLPIPRRRGTNEEPSSEWTMFGAYWIGWNVRLESNEPVAPCFKFRVGIGPNEGDSCEESFSEESTQFVRTGAVYGLCGATYAKEGNERMRLPIDRFIGQVYAEGSCLIQ